MQGVSFSNPLVLAVDEARRPLPGWAAVLIALVVLGLSLVGGLYAYLAAAPLAAGLGQGLPAAVADRALQVACIVGPMALAALLLGKLYEGRPTARGGTPAGAALALGLFVGGLGFAVTIGAAAGLGVAAPGEGGLLAAVGPGIAASAVLVALQAGGEELFFRGWLQPLLSARWGPWIALTLTSVLFGLSHALIPLVMGAPSGALALLNMILGGLVFGLLALRTGGLWAPIAAHWAWNWSEMALAGATPNPGVDPLGSVFDLELAGAALLSGGADELNGSVLVTAVMVVLALGLGLLGSPRRRKAEAIDPAKWMPILGKDPAGPARS